MMEDILLPLSLSLQQSGSLVGCHHSGEHPAHLDNYLQVLQFQSSLCYLSVSTIVRLQIYEEMKRKYLHLYPLSPGDYSQDQEDEKSPS